MQLQIVILLGSFAFFLSKDLFSQPSKNSGDITTTKTIPKPSPPPAPKGTLIISVDYNCILKINGKVIDTLTPDEPWVRKLPHGYLLLETILLKDKSIIVKNSVELKKGTKPVIIDFSNKITEKNNQILQQKKIENDNRQREESIRLENERNKKVDQLNKLIGDYKISFSSASNYSERLNSLKRQILSLDPKAGKICGKCDGSGEIEVSNTCSYCDGDNEVDCGRCSEGKVSCTNCAGVGSFTCRFNFYNLVYCNDCGCRGCYSGYHNRITCAQCRGYGYLLCSNCDHTGVVQCRECDDGEVLSQVCCKTCKGIGIIF